MRGGATLYFVRHGETDWNAEGRMQGQQDIPLNDVGRLQARDVAEKLREAAPHVETLDFVCSPMLRTRQTMEIMRAALGLDPQAYRIDDRLRELTFGSWEGLTWKEVRARDPEGAARRKADKWGYVPPSGESYAMLAERIEGFLASVERDMVVVAHGGVARAFLRMAAGLSRQEAPVIDIWQGRVLVFRDGRHSWV